MIEGREAAVIFVAIVAGSSIVITWVRAHYASLKGPRSADLERLEQRLAHIEQALDAVAVETERISEGQRFTTKLLADRAPARSAE
jgi:hypothetical protein